MPHDKVMGKGNTEPAFSLSQAQHAPPWLLSGEPCQTHDLVVVSLRPGRGEISFWFIFPPHLC